MDTALPSHLTHFSLNALSPSERYPLWKESISVIFDVYWDESCARQSFDAQIDSAHLGQVMLVETTSLGQRFDRTPVQIRKDGVDHCLIQVYLEGETCGLWGTREHSTARAGDVLFLDTAQTVQSQVSDFRNLTLLVPRAVLTPYLVDPERHHGCMLRRDSSSGRLLAEHLRLLWELLKTTPPDEARQISLGLVDLVGRYFGGGHYENRQPESASTRLALRESIRTHIEQRLEESGLGPDTLAQRFGLSRATLYRLFEPLGGVNGYIQKRRLLRAHALLMNTSTKPLNLTCLALQLGFKHPSHFSRAFRDRFGYCPSEANEHSLVTQFFASDQRSGVDRSYEQWVRELG